MGRQPSDVLVPELSAVTRTVPLRRVGHKGADLIAPGNTLASFDAALEAGVDMIEFDVLPEDQHALATTPLLLAHDYGHPLDQAMTLEQGLDHLASETFGTTELDVDLKLPGYEPRVVLALQERGLVERTIVSSQFMGSLGRIRALEPGLRLGWSVPRVRRDYAGWYWKPLVLLALASYRARLPRTAAGHIAEGRIDAVMAYDPLVTPALLRAVHGAGGDLYAWTIDDVARIRRLEAMGVDAVITNDPRLFSSE